MHDVMLIRDDGGDGDKIDDLHLIYQFFVQYKN